MSPNQRNPTDIVDEVSLNGKVFKAIDCGVALEQINQVKQFMQ